MSGERQKDIDQRDEVVDGRCLMMSVVLGGAESEWVLSLYHMPSRVTRDCQIWNRSIGAEKLFQEEQMFRSYR